MARRKRKTIIDLADNGLGRVFIHPCCIGDVQYNPCISVDTVTVSRGTPTVVYCPSSSVNDNFDIAKIIPGGKGLYTSSLNTHMTMDTINQFKKLFEANCPFNISIHYGGCDSADDFYNYTKIIFFKNVTLTDYSIESLVALQATDRATINESISISFEEMLILNMPNDLTTFTIFDTIVDSFIILADNSCATCKSCTLCFCSNLGIIVNDSQLVISSWQDNNNRLILAKNDGTFDILIASDYIDNQIVHNVGTVSVTLDIGESVTVGTFRSVGTDFGKLFYIDGRQKIITLLDTNGIPITSITHKPYEKLLAGDDNGNLYVGFPEKYVKQLTNSPTTNSITATSICNDDSYIIGDVTGALYSSIDAGETWQQILYVNDGSAIRSIECCDCIQFFIGTDTTLFYSTDSLSTLEIINEDYTNYKHILCCDTTNDVIILAENGTDSVILSTNFE